MAVRLIDGNELVDTLKQIVSDYTSHGMYPSAFPVEYAIEIVEKMPTLTPPNEPLTLDELLKMDGEPVYVVFRPDNSGDKPQFWALVSADKQHDEVYLLDSMGGAGSYDEIWANLEAIYRRPPEGGKYEVL